DGDGSSDIALTVAVDGSSTGGDVRAYHADGTLLAGFPKVLPLGFGAVPAIADIDLDGRNELIVTSAYWGRTPGSYPKVWAFDLHGSNYGAVEWGQFMHDAQHTGTYSTPAPAAVPAGLKPFFVYPNPVTVGRVLHFHVEQLSTPTEMAVYDASGRLVRRHLDPRSSRGWDLRDDAGHSVSSGVYFVSCPNARLTRVAVVN